jgi:hypothetical protein
MIAVHGPFSIAERNPNRRRRSATVSAAALAKIPDGARDVEDKCVSVRSYDGQRPIGSVTSSQAAELVAGGAAAWRRTNELWLTEEASRHNGNPRTWLKAQPGKRLGFGHNTRVCRQW